METNLTPFRDMDGNPVTVGDNIVIVHDYRPLVWFGSISGFNYYRCNLARYLDCF